MLETKRPSIRLDEKLWQAIAAHNFNDGPAALTFEQRLARENSWSAAYSARVIGEYRRFLYLAARAGHPVTPPDDVDQVWHLHLVYTRNYWDVMCRKVLGAPLHHGPTAGGADETAKYTDWYGRTLDSYRAHFGEDPPRDVWPEPEARFAGQERFQRVDTAKHWVIAKPWLSGLWVGLGLGAAAMVPWVQTVGEAVAASGGRDLGGNGLLQAYWIALFMNCFLLATGNRRIAFVFSVFVMPVLMGAFYGSALLQRPDWILAGVAIWGGISLIMLLMFYRRRKRSDGSSSTGCGSGCSGGCWTYTGGRGDGSPGGDGGSDGGSGCGGGCGGGD